MPALHLDIFALAVLAAAAVAFTRQRRPVLLVCAGLFVCVGSAGAWLSWSPVSPVLARALLAVAMGLPLLTLLLYAVDRLWAPFCVEMTYPAMVCWLLWPALAAAAFCGLLLH
jgi:ABC-type proline/glycine betaine transport system permease subunit